jgi:isoaspartyl peptidase/L-asparaginase-like protein (Ntn-hydrolase superfamily)
MKQADDSEVLFGSVGAVPRVRNPVLVAARLLREQVNGGDLTCGRIPPSFLVGDGAATWAAERGIPVLDSDPDVESFNARSHSCTLPDSVQTSEASSLITKGAVRQYRDNLEKLKRAEKRRLSLLSSGPGELENVRVKRKYHVPFGSAFYVSES